MVMRVATFSQSSKILANAMETQAKLASNQAQQASGNISEDYAGLGADAAALVDLEVSISRSKSSVSAASDTLSRVETTYTALGAMSDILTTMRAAIAAVMTSEELPQLQVFAAGYLEDLSALLNTQFAGRYLFAGSLTEDVPADISTYAAADLTTIDTSYYSGDTYTQSVRLSADRTLDYGVPGDAVAIEEAMRALSYAASATSLTMNELEDLTGLVVSAQDGIIALQSVTSTTATSLETHISSEESYIASAEELAVELSSSDFASLIVEATTYEVQLEASYAVLGTLQDLSVLNYLFR